MKPWCFGIRVLSIRTEHSKTYSPCNGLKGRCISDYSRGNVGFVNITGEWQSYSRITQRTRDALPAGSQLDLVALFSSEDATRLLAGKNCKCKLDHTLFDHTIVNLMMTNSYACHDDCRVRTTQLALKFRV